MIVNVHMLAFMNGEIPPVEIPNGTPYEHVLDETFHYGQNHIAPSRIHASVSGGDIVEHNGELWLCKFVGWMRLTREQFDVYRKLDRRERMSHRFKLEEEHNMAPVWIYFNFDPVGMVVLYGHWSTVTNGKFVGSGYIIDPDKTITDAPFQGWDVKPLNPVIIERTPLTLRQKMTNELRGEGRHCREFKEDWVKTDNFVTYLNTLNDDNFLDTFNEVKRIIATIEED